jgi:acyl dehydratase
MSTRPASDHTGQVRYFEDFAAGDVIELGSRTITKEAIIAFAREFDPQVFHVDEDASRQTAFGGLIASGWHTGSLAMRLFCDGVIGRSASLGSPGIDELRWIRPVRPGDTLSGRMTVVESVPSRSKPDRGLVRSLLELRNQHGDLVLTLKGMNLISRRPPGPA